MNCCEFLFLRELYGTILILIVGGAGKNNCWLDTEN